MKTFDHEPTISELFDLFEQENLYVPPFIPYPKESVEIEKMVKAGLRKTFTFIMLS